MAIRGGSFLSRFSASVAALALAFGSVLLAGAPAQAAGSIQLAAGTYGTFTTTSYTNVATATGTTPRINGYLDSDSVRVTLSTDSGLLNLTSTSGLTAVSSSSLTATATIQFTATVANANTALASLQFKGTSAGVLANFSLEVSLGGGAVLGTHYYEYVSSATTWTAAYAAAKLKTVPSTSGGGLFGLSRNDYFSK